MFSGRNGVVCSYLGSISAMFSEFFPLPLPLPLFSFSTDLVSVTGAWAWGLSLGAHGLIAGWRGLLAMGAVFHLEGGGGAG